MKLFSLDPPPKTKRTPPTPPPLHRRRPHFSHHSPGLMINMWTKKGDCCCVLSVREHICQEINCNKSPAQLIYRTIVELICLMNHIIHPIILWDLLNNRPLKINRGREARTGELVAHERICFTGPGKVWARSPSVWKRRYSLNKWP